MTERQPTSDNSPPLPIEPTAASERLIDKQLIRRAVPIVAATILGGLLTGVPTVWVSVSQQRVQIDLARRAEHEQMRQRRIQAAKNYLSACTNLAIAAERVADSIESRSALSVPAARHQEAVNLYSVSLAELVAEFQLSGISLADSVAVLNPADLPATQSQLPSKQRALGVRANAAVLDRSCRETTTKLLTRLRTDDSKK